MHYGKFYTMSCLTRNAPIEGVVLQVEHAEVCQAPQKVRDVSVGVDIANVGELGQLLGRQPRLLKARQICGRCKQEKRYQSTA